MKSIQISKILVPVDFTDISLNALDTAVAMIKRHNAILTIINVIDNDYLLGLPESYNTIDVAMDKYKRLSLDLLSQLVAKLKAEHNISADIKVVWGHVSSSIVKCAVENNVDLIVLGTHGISGFREFFIGSNAYDVVKNSVCPVLTVPPLNKWISFSNILFPVRAVPGTLKKYHFIGNVIRKNKAMLHLMALNMPDKKTSTKYLKDVLKKLYSEVLDDDVIATVIYKDSKKFATDVIKRSETIRADLIVVTADIDKSWKNFFIGPYVQRIVNHSKVPVLIIKPGLAKHYNEEILDQLEQKYKQI